MRVLNAEFIPQIIATPIIVKNLLNQDKLTKHIRKYENDDFRGEFYFKTYIDPKPEPAMIAGSPRWPVKIMVITSTI